MSIAITRRFLDEAVYKGEGTFDNSNSKSEDVLSIDNPLDLQAGHSTRTAHLIYGRGVVQGSYGIAVLQQQYRLASTSWHKLFQFTSSNYTP
jgi:hypothetical protein